jgi:hypothetical protein
VCKKSCAAENIVATNMHGEWIGLANHAYGLARNFLAAGALKRTLPFFSNRMGKAGKDIVEGTT